MEEDYSESEELEGQEAAASLLLYLKQTEVSKQAVEKLQKNIRLCDRNRHKRPRCSNSRDFAAIVKREPFHDQEENNNAAIKLPGEPHLERIFDLINDYQPPRRPSIPGLDGLIGNCSKPFEKQLTHSDLNDGQSRLIINTEYVKNHLCPLLREGEEPKAGIKVITYDHNGKPFHMKFKVWASNVHVLTAGWKPFFREHKLKKDQDFVTLWMFRRVDTNQLCFLIHWRRLPVSHQIKKRTVKKKKLVD